jgi:hypothetical protein
MCAHESTGSDISDLRREIVASYAISACKFSLPPSDYLQWKPFSRLLYVLKSCFRCLRIPSNHLIIIRFSVMSIKFHFIFGVGSNKRILVSTFSSHSHWQISLAPPFATQTHTRFNIVSSRKAPPPSHFTKKIYYIQNHFVRVKTLLARAKSLELISILLVENGQIIHYEFSFSRSLSFFLGWGARVNR